SKSVRETADKSLTVTQKTQLDFWHSFKEYVETTGSRIRCQKPGPQTWMLVAIGRSGVTLEGIFSSSNTEGKSGVGEIRVELLMSDDRAKTYFAELETMKAEIEKDFGGPMIWSNPEELKQAKVYVRKDAQVNDRDDWPNQHAWLKENLEKFDRIFRDRVKALSPDN
ncbi:MAG: DUF4268 domain-containing protein, partial [Candidatus Omnitrophica bacterium]|nr:DUF4268 domain-containing protein [Candidatus Omnitrophota bacterium]